MRGVQHFVRVSEILCRSDLCIDKTRAAAVLQKGFIYIEQSSPSAVCSSRDKTLTKLYTLISKGTLPTPGEPEINYRSDCKTAQRGIDVGRNSATWERLKDKTSVGSEITAEEKEMFAKMIIIPFKRLYVVKASLITSWMWGDVEDIKRYMKNVFYPLLESSLWWL